MEALNAKERTIALLKFLAVFLVLIILIVLGIFYNYDIPSKQLKMVKAELATYKESNQNRKIVAANLDSLFYQLSRYDKDPNQLVLNRTIANELANLGSISSQDSSDYGKLILRAASGYNMDFTDKQTLVSLGKDAASIGDKDQKIKDLKDQIEKDETNIDNLRLKLKACSN